VIDHEITERVIGCAIEVHKTIGGPGLLESVYEEALAWEMEQAGLLVGRQVCVPILYKNVRLSTPLRIDLLVNQRIVVECKSVTQYNQIFEAQALTYLRLSGLRIAPVINFGEALLKNGIHRVVNGY
jgi:GxxExxY protein